MVKPTSKAPEIEEFLDNVGKEMFGRTRSESIASNTCATCGGEAKEFCDELSQKEYSISGMCQKCQDEVYG